MNEIVNKQKDLKLPLENLSLFIKRALERIPETNGKSVIVSFISDAEMRELNNNFRKQNSTTDVLSFPFSAEEFEKDQNLLGDIIISAEQAKRQAKENNIKLELEIKQLILHGVLHLAGYDHETDNGKMNSLELQLRDKLGVS